MRNSGHILFISADDASQRTSRGGGAYYPNLGLLTLMSAVEHRLDMPDLCLGYYDGAVHGNGVLEDFIDNNAAEIYALCFSVLTHNYKASIALARRAKEINPNVVVILGNDHFSALFTRIMRRQDVVDFGFYGNDVVQGFAEFLVDHLAGRLRPALNYAGLVYRDLSGGISKNPENPAEYGHLPLVDYGLADSFVPHLDHYLTGQRSAYMFMRDQGLRSQVVDIGRGCVKFAGERLEDIPLNACDFCAIIPGVREIAAPDVNRAWAILENVYRQGFNNFYLTADELPLTLWRLIRGMAANMPEWFSELPPERRPRMFGYARAEAFSTYPERIDTMVNVLGMDHFFIGFDGLSDTSLRVMNKQAVAGRGRAEAPMEQNLRALDGVANRGGLISAGIVTTHLGITPELMAENHAVFARIVESHSEIFAAMDFGPLIPIPGSQSFRYLTHPEHAERRAAEFGLRVDRDYLESRKDFYRVNDCIDMDEMVADFIAGCCPDISMDLVDEYIDKMEALATQRGITVVPRS